MSEIVIYAGDLQAIAAVDTQSEVKNATDETLANLKVFAQTMDTAADKLGSGDWKLATTISPYVTPVSDAATYALGQGLEEEKIAALRKATTAMNSIFGNLMDICKASVDAGETIKKNKLQTAYNDADLAYQTDKTSRAKLDTLRAAAAAYDTALATDVTSQFDDLAKAHAALVAALKLPKPDFKSAWLALQQAIQTAVKIQGLMQEFEAAGKPSKT
jgi:hypothetical protein